MEVNGGLRTSLSQHYSMSNSTMIPLSGHHNNIHNTTITGAGDLEEDAVQLEQDLEQEQTTIRILRGSNSHSSIHIAPL
jgi:hypothetical protein